MVLEDMSDEEVDQGVADVHAELCGVWRRLLALVGEHDRRGLWQLSGSRNEAKHLEQTLSVSWRTANDWVRVAHALDRQPRWGERFADGVFSLDQLVHLVTLADAERAGACDPLGPFDDLKPGGSGGAGGAGDPSGAGGDSSGGDRSGAGGSQPGWGADPEPGGDDPSDVGADADAAAARLAEELAELAARLNPAQLGRLARRARRKSREEADRLHRRRRMSVQLDETASSLRVEGVFFDDDAATLAAAIDVYLGRCTHNPETGRYDPLEIRHADAVVAMARSYLSATGGRDPRPTVVVHTDARVLSGADGWAETTGWTALAAETVRRLACFCKLNVVAEGDDAVPVGVGREQRLAPDWLADLVRHRDGGCRFCGSKLFTEIHHIVPWEWPYLGRTDLDTMCELCSRDHHLTHEGGWRIEGDVNGELRFISPTGLVLTSYPAGWAGAPARRAVQSPRPMPAPPTPGGAHPTPSEIPPTPAEGTRGVAPKGSRGNRRNGSGPPTPAGGSLGDRRERSRDRPQRSVPPTPAERSRGHGRQGRANGPPGSAPVPFDEPRLFDDS